MKVSRAKTVQTRKRIIESAASLFRERGFDKVGVAELMKSIEMTHGGFYSYFSSKEDLITLASEHALSSSVDEWQQLTASGGEDALYKFASTYLSPAHRDRPGEGCSLAALGGEAARHRSPLRAAFTQGVRSTAELLTNLMPHESPLVTRERALATYASMVGALVLARAVDDDELSNDVLRSVLVSITSPDLSEFQEKASSDLSTCSKEPTARPPQFG